MLLTTQGGIEVNFDHIAYAHSKGVADIALKREETSPSTPQPAESTHKVLLFMGTGDGTSIVAARHLTLPQACFVREDIGHSWETEKKRWRATESLKRHAEGAYFANLMDSSSEQSEESEGNDG